MPAWAVRGKKSQKNGPDGQLLNERPHSLENGADTTRRSTLLYPQLTLAKVQKLLLGIISIA